MFAFDTNLLVRLLTNDEPGQAVKAEAWLRANTSAKTPAYVDHIVLCELAARYAPVLTLDKKAAKTATHRLLR